MDVQRLGASFCRYDELYSLIRSAFACMDGRIDPPSSALRLTAASLEQKALAEIVFLAVDRDDIVGCIFCRPETDCLYVGKLAVLPERQGSGVGRMLLSAAERQAHALGLSALRLETRIELVENHTRFRVWGFEKTAEKRHAGYDRTTSIEMTKRL
ncbi:GNAT family N-acetyltransferase [Mycoplana ramosa]|uniref:GNAT family N-acetyltransferase n=1 Tax=Mycoplana ramosa TaxID=40837 RepID=A0ABW3Z0H1_MYCRA